MKICDEIVMASAVWNKIKIVTLPGLQKYLILNVVSKGHFP